MEIEKVTDANKQYIKYCDKLFEEFLESEQKYDTNVASFIPKSFENDIYKDNVIMYIAKAQDEVIAFLYGFIQDTGKIKLPIAHLTFIYVVEKYRNKKVATDLINSFCQEIKDKNIEIIEVKSFNQNEAANKLYEKLGFKPLWTNYRKM